MRSRRRFTRLLLLVLALVVGAQLPFASAATDPHTPIGSTPFQEGSGVVASRQHANVHWAHVDSGSPETYNKLWAFHVENGAMGRFPSGATFKEFTVPNTLNRDWEDITTDSSGNLWIADIGNNSCTRSNLVIHKVKEPDPYGSSTTVQVLASYPIEWPAANYGDGCTGPDAESIFLIGGTPYFITKQSPTPQLFKMTTFNTGSKNVLEKVANLTGTSDPGEIGRPTGADLSRDGKRLIISTPGYKAFVYKSASTTLTGEALVRDAISRPPAHTIKYRTDSNWEAVEGAALTGNGYDALLLSESSRVLYFPEAYYGGTTTQPAPEPTTQPTTSPSPAPAPTDSSRLGWMPRPGEGVLTGFTVTGRDYNTELAKVRAGAPNYKPAMSREFFQWGTAPAQFVDRANDRAAVGVDRIIVNISGSGTVFADISAGRQDAWIRSVASALQNARRPVLLTWFHEPHAHVTESPHVPAGTSYAAACAAYADAYRHIIEQWRAVNSMTTYVYQSTEYRLSQGDGPDCYPGNNHIDLIGYTGANGYTQQNPWKTPMERLDQARAFIRSTGKRAIVMAGGSAEDPNSPGTRKANFYDGITAAMKSEPLMAVYVMVSTEFTDTGSVQWVDTTNAALTKWREVVQRPFHTGSASPSPEPTTSPAPTPTTSPSPAPTTSPSPTPTTQPEPTPTSQPDPVEDVIVRVTRLAPWKVIERNAWRAKVTARATDTDGNPIAGAVLTNTWSAGRGSVSCTTGADGECTTQSDAIRKATSVTYTLKSISHPSYPGDLRGSLTTTTVTK